MSDKKSMLSSRMMSDDQELAYIRKAASGDHEAFRHLVLTYETPVLTYLHSILGISQGSLEIWEDRYVVRELLRKALSQLSTDDALCLVLRFIAGERYAEIAERLGMTKEAVRKRVARGLVALRSAYQALDQEK